MSDILQNEIAPSVPVELGDKKIELFIDLSAVLRYKAKTGDNLYSVSCWKKLDEDPERLIALVWCAMQKHQPETQYEDVEKLVNIGTATIFSAAIVKLMDISIPKPQKVDGAEAADPNASSQK